MLIQMPRGSVDRPGSPKADECSPFEAALRRDLASAPVVSYEAMLGGWPKRTLDFTLTLLSSPIWAPLLICLAVWAKERHPAPVFQAHERIGYGGRPFKYFTMRLAPPTAVVERLHPANESGSEETAEPWTEIAGKADHRHAKWFRALERLPQLFNVLRGDMALVGPSPLTREQLGELRTAKRYYLSARPGLVGVSGVADAHDENASQYKIYALAWSHATDALILWDALLSLIDQGELWEPRRRVLKSREEPQPAQRRSSAAE